MSYPTSLDSFTTPTSSQKLNSPSHSGIESAQNTALSAVETKLGVDSSAVTTTVDYLLKNASSSDPGHKHTFSSLSQFNVGGSPAANDVLQYNGSKWVNAAATSLGLKFGGTGSDGALSVSSGTTTINCASAQVVVKNYTSISITGSGTLAFSNPHANGTTIILKSQGAVTLTSSSAPMIDGSGMGGAAASNGFSISGLAVGGGGNGTNTTGGAAGAIAVFAPANAITASAILAGKYPFACPGGGGGNSFNGVSGNGGGGGGSILAAGSGTTNTNTNTGVGRAGGLGGGVLIIECGGAWNFTTASGISVAGKNGVAGSSSNDGGGGGGGGGVLLAFYNSLTTNSGTITVSGGTGGAKTGSGTAGGNGANGYSTVSANTEFV